MLKSIATVCLSGALPEKLAAIAEAGFAGVEIFENDLMVSELSPREARRAIDDLGLVCTCYQPFRDFEGWSGAARAQAFDRAERKFDLMGELGAELMLVCSNVLPGTSGDHAQLADDFAELGERAARRRLRVGYEALAWGRHVSDHRDAWDIVRRADHPAIGIILDSFHSLARGVPTASIADIPGERIFLMQIADAPGIPMEPLYWSRHFRCFPGQGDFAVADYVAAALRQGYAGPLSLEIFNDRFRSWSPQQIADDGHRSLVALEDCVRQLGQDAPALDAPLPPRGTPSGITFIEFAAEGEEGDALEAWFEGLGFVASGGHRTKAVTRWQQGEVNLIVNREGEGFAHAHQLLHGASVCAFGLGIDDAEATMARAERLGIDAFTQRAGPGELALPSVRAVGGSLLYFTPERPSPAFWDTDFAPQGARSSGHGLLRVDHLAQSMPQEEFLSWQLYYTTLLATERKAPVDVADPLGLVQSQAIESADGGLRITLNGAAGQTLASRFVNRYLGAGVQHIAFTTDDIFATVAAMRAAGVAMLAMPDNYYDDLDARFGLGAERIARLRDHGLMYDRQGDGEYLQAYTRAFRQRLFFEIVERRSYATYGAANAPVRLAAQARTRIDTAP